MPMTLTATLLNTVSGWEPVILWGDKVLARADRWFHQAGCYGLPQRLAHRRDKRSATVWPRKPRSAASIRHLRQVSVQQADHNTSTKESRPPGRERLSLGPFLRDTLPTWPRAAKFGSVPLASYGAASKHLRRTKERPPQAVGSDLQVEPLNRYSPQHGYNRFGSITFCVHYHGGMAAPSPARLCSMTAPS